MHDRLDPDPDRLDPDPLDLDDPLDPDDPARRPLAADPDRRRTLPSPPRGRPQLTLLRGGRADAPAPFVVAPPALFRLDRVATPAEIDMDRCRRVWRTGR